MRMKHRKKDIARSAERFRSSSVAEQLQQVGKCKIFDRLSVRTFSKDVRAALGDAATSKHAPLDAPCSSKLQTPEPSEVLELLVVFPFGSFIATLNPKTLNPPNLFQLLRPLYCHLSGDGYGSQP